MLGPGRAQLNFNLYTNTANTAPWTSSSLLTRSLNIPRNRTVTGTLPFYGAIPAGQGQPVGGYEASFFETALGFTTNNSLCQEKGTVNGIQISGQDGTVNVAAAVGAACSVAAASGINLGTVPPNATNIAGSGGSRPRVAARTTRRTARD